MEMAPRRFGRSTVDGTIPWHDRTWPVDGTMTMREEEVVNGYHLVTTDQCIMDYRLFCELIALVREEKKPLDVFLVDYIAHTCVDWGKVNEHGESVPWSELTRRRNGRLLWELPFSSSFLVKTMELGCGNRMESVRYSNFLGVWVTRKWAEITLPLVLLTRLPSDIVRHYFWRRK